VSTADPTTGAIPTPVLEAEHLVKHFPVRHAFGTKTDAIVHAVDDVSFALAPNETLGLVGESGSGKSTTGRLLLRLLEPTAGRVRYDGADITTWSRRQLRPIRRRLQAVFQDPYASLNPRMSVSDILNEPFVIQGRRSEGKRRVPELLEMVGLSPEHASRFPHEFSGGQRQRIGIARALALEPDVLVLDEPVSALDVSIQAQILNLLLELQNRLSVAYLFIAHDLSVVRHISDRVAVMYAGKIVEIGMASAIYDHAGHPYTQALLTAAPVSDPRRERERHRMVLKGESASPTDPPSGCRFRTRCWKAEAICAEEEPALIDRGQGHPVACHFAEAITAV
jgi:oligopeptide/dipeptide ABC transporter ATP-binding protein